MSPYVSCPFLYYRNIKNMPPPEMMPTMPPMPPVLPPMQAPVTTMPPMPIAPPMQPNYPQMPPIMAPMMPNYPAPMMPDMGFMNPEMNDMGNMGDMMNMDEMDLETNSPRQPAPVLSNNPAVTNISLFKELTGYPNYGNPSGNADILYTGTQGTWTFNVPPTLFGAGNRTAQIVIRAVLDDHTRVPLTQYSARITINGIVVHNAAVPLEHGVPVGGRFTNWRELRFSIANLRRTNNRITIVNTSTAGSNDWIGIDWMEIRVRSR